MWQQQEQQEKGAEFAKLRGTTRVRGQKTQVAFGLQSTVGYKASCLALNLTRAPSFSPVGLSQLLTLIKAILSSTLSGTLSCSQSWAVQK